ncbi:GGDEF domain-containing protein [Aliiglaciecola litoralis]|uniref:diguanylate cyclase n=1 Tax=Aliiglaciecola litoralis TaxID=582857 RepID=A0ABP3X590_9ALTE
MLKTVVNHYCNLSLAKNNVLTGDLFRLLECLVITQSQLNSSSSISIKQIRILLVVASLFMMSFMAADLPLLPEQLHHDYLLSRLGFQLPIMFVVFGLTYAPFYSKIHDQVLWMSVLLITYANYWLTIVCWLKMQFSFPYEGVLLYALFATFIMRMSFKYSLIYVGCSVVGFTLMVTILPIYGEFTAVKLGFVMFGLATALLGVHQIEKTFKKLKIVNSKLTILSEIDQLTGIYNRGTFEAKFFDMIKFAKRTNSYICVFIIDLDNFKDYNDGYGHLQGDEVIKLQADILNRVFNRESDLIARYGGEEFVVACINQDDLHFENLAQSIIHHWQEEKVPHGKGKGGDFVCCSIGVYASKANRYNNGKIMIEQADKALYRAKAQGRGRFVNGSKI